MDREADSAILELNRRYKECRNREQNKYYYKFLRYWNNLKRGHVKKVIEDLNYRRYAIKHFTTAGNIIEAENSAKVDISPYRIAVYTCITGNYDKISEPLYREPNIDYFLFTDSEVDQKSKWEKIDITAYDEYKVLTPKQMNRRIKMFPFHYLDGYDYSIYVDGNIEIVAPLSPLIEKMGNSLLGVHYHNYRDCIYDEYIAARHYNKVDIDLAEKQLAAYESEGYPHHFGLYENGVLIRKHSSEAVKKLMTSWWDEYLKYPTRDQFSLPYIIWKTEFEKASIHIIGRNLNMNLRFNREIMH